MNHTRRRFMKLAGAAAFVPAAPYIARAQGGYPNRPVHWIVGQAAGSSSDITARLIGQWLSEKLGQQFMVEVRPGAAGNIATEFVDARGAGRLHAAADECAEHHQRHALRKARLRFRPRHRAGRRHRPRAAGDGGEPVVSGQDHSRVHRLCEGQSRARSTWRRPASAGRSTPPASCSSPWPASTWCTCPIAARRRR